MRYFFFMFTLFLFVYSGCGGSGTNPGNDTLSNKFSDIQKVILTPSCATTGSCHIDSTSLASGDGLDLRAGVAYYQLMHHVIQNRVAGTKYQRLVVPGSPDSSFLVEVLTDASLKNGDDFGERMPQRRSPLAQDKIDAIVS